MAGKRTPGPARVVLLAAALAGGGAHPLLPAVPADRIDIAVSREGFRPDRVTVRKGEPIRLALTSSDGVHCFAIDAFRIEKRVVAGRPTVVELTPDRGGTFVYYDCLAEPADKAREGQLVVTE